MEIINKVEERRRQMLGLVEEWQKRRQTQKIFAEVKLINYLTHGYWIHKHEKVKKQTEGNRSFVKFSPVVSPGMIIHYANGKNIIYSIFTTHYSIPPTFTFPCILYFLTFAPDKTKNHA